MHALTNKFYEYCLNNLIIDDEEMYKYKSLPICIIDCVYSLRAKYYQVTVPIVKRYADTYLKGNIYDDTDTISKFINNLEECGLDNFSDNVVKNHQILGGESKAKVCYMIATHLRDLKIETIEDFKNFPSEEILTLVLKSIRGMGDAGVNYLFMLAGDENKAKPDVHIHRAIKNACGSDVTNEEVEIILKETTLLFKEKYPNLTIRKLDSIIWEKFQGEVNK